MSEQGRQHNQKLKAFLIYKYLLENSDANHCFSAGDIADFLINDMGISAERRSIYKDIDEINKALLALKHEETLDWAEDKLEENDKYKAIVYDASKKGFYVKKRECKLSEISAIAECIYSAKFITEEQAYKYVEIITDILASKYQAEEILHEAVLLDRGKTINDTVFENVQKINKAMKRKSGKDSHTPEKISFKYLTTTINKTVAERRHGEKYIVSPYKLVINDGNYYLLGYDDKSAAARTYRVDRMKDIKLLGLPRDGEELFRTVEEKTLLLQNFGMYDGKKEFVTLRFINPLLDTVVDKFGKKHYFQKIDDKHFSVQVQVPITDQFFGWLCGFGKRVKIICPPPIQDKFKEYLDKIRSIY